MNGPRGLYSVRARHDKKRHSSRAPASRAASSLDRRRIRSSARRLSRTTADPRSHQSSLLSSFPPGLHPERIGSWPRKTDISCGEDSSSGSVRPRRIEDRQSGYAPPSRGLGGIRRMASLRRYSLSASSGSPPRSRAFYRDALRSCSSGSPFPRGSSSTSPR
jgi:hypothetical protein